MNKAKNLSDNDKQGIFTLVDKGYSNEEIGKKYNVTPQSVAAYKAWRTRR